MAKGQKKVVGRVGEICAALDQQPDPATTQRLVGEIRARYPQSSLRVLNGLSEATRRVLNLSIDQTGRLSTPFRSHATAETSPEMAISQLPLTNIGELIRPAKNEKMAIRTEGWPLSVNGYGSYDDSVLARWNQARNRAQRVNLVRQTPQISSAELERIAAIPGYAPNALALKTAKDILDLLSQPCVRGNQQQVEWEVVQPDQPPEFFLRAYDQPDNTKGFLALVVNEDVGSATERHAQFVTPRGQSVFGHRDFNLRATTIFALDTDWADLLNDGQQFDTSMDVPLLGEGLKSAISIVAEGDPDIVVPSYASLVLSQTVHLNYLPL